MKSTPNIVLPSKLVSSFSELTQQKQQILKPKPKRTQDDFDLLSAIVAYAELISREDSKFAEECVSPNKSTSK